MLWRMRGQVLLGLALLLVCSGCATSTATATKLIPAGGFRHTLGRQHALSGRIYASRPQAFVPLAVLERALIEAQYVVLGETHDNLDHHRLEAELLKRLLAHAPRAAVGFEMLDETQRAVLAQAQPQDPDELARKLRWSESGWPEFAQYRPVFAEVLARHARIVAAHPSPEHVRASLAGVPPEEAQALQLDLPLTAAAASALEREIVAAHCGHASPAMVTAMQRAQSYKDAFMARELIRAGAPSALVTGRGHARNDRGVPRFLKLLGATRVISVAFVEVEDRVEDPKAYEADAFDVTVFTPRQTDQDPCEQFEQQLKQMHSPPATDPAD